MGIALGASFVGKNSAKLVYKGAAKLNKIRKKVGTKRPKKSDSRGKALILGAEASRYLKSYIHPFDPEVRSAHIPTTPSYPTYKVMGFIRGTGYIGTQGIGFVAFAPTVANDSSCVYYTTAAYAQNMAAPAASDSGILSGGATIPAIAVMSNLPYTSSQITATTRNAKIEPRIVSAALRLQFTGTELNRSGLVYAYTDPDGDNTLGDSHTLGNAGNGYTIDQLSAKEATEIVPVRKGYTQLVALPPTSYGTDFTNQNANVARQIWPYSVGDNITINGNTNGGASTLIMITGIPGQSFYFEAITHAEYVGAGVVQSLLTPGEADVVGLDAVQNLLSKAQRAVVSDAQASFAKAVKDTMAKENIKFGTGKRSVDY